MQHIENKLLEVISGSHSYGLNTKDSDLDIRGVFQLNLEDVIKRKDQRVIQDATNDIIFTELYFFLEQLANNTPSALEVFFTNKPEHIKLRDKRFEDLKPEMILSKKIFYTYGSYALSQIKKAKSVNKKSVNPQPEDRKHLKDFAFVMFSQNTISFDEFIEKRSIKVTDLSMTKVHNARDVYALYLYPSQGGPFAETNVNLHAIPKGLEPISYISVNFEEYCKHCREHKEYWEWVSKRNEKRYITNVEKTGYRTFYDTKNMMHLFRLMNSCEEVLRDGTLTVYRDKDRDFLLKIRNGGFSYEELIEMSSAKQETLEKLFNTSTLPDQPDKMAILDFVYNFYK